MKNMVHHDHDHAAFSHQECKVGLTLNKKPSIPFSVTQTKIFWKVFFFMGFEKR